MSDDSLIYFGGAVKALGGGKIGGILAPFGSPEDADPQGDFFTRETDFGLDVSDRARVVYHHGFTKVFGSRKLGVVRMARGREGLEVVEGVLDLSDPAVKGLYEKAEAGALFWSSGSVDRLVVRRDVRGKSEIVAWPLVEVSLTPNPVNRRARAYAVKSLLDDPEALRRRRNRNRVRAGMY